MLAEDICMDITVAVGKVQVCIANLKPYGITMPAVMDVVVDVVVSLQKVDLA